MYHIENIVFVFMKTQTISCNLSQLPFSRIRHFIGEKKNDWCKYHIS